MAGKVFISCGQANASERQVAVQLSAWFVSQGFQPYVAIQTQSILEVNAGIIGELKNSDFYLFINFRREKIRHRLLFPSSRDFYRGSVFTNQELAIAYAMRFDSMIFVNHRGVRRDGLFSYIGSNTPEFETYDEVLPIVQTAIRTANWQASYSRNLIYRNLRWSTPILYKDHTRTSGVKVLHIDIANGRPDQGASNSILRLKSITHNGVTNISPDTSHLKCSGFPGYSNIIWPNDHVAFDLLSIDIDRQSEIYLHSALDVTPRDPIVTAIGDYDLAYQSFAENYPSIEFKILLHVTGNEATTTATLI